MTETALAMQRPQSSVRVLVVLSSEVVRRGLGSMLTLLPEIADVTDYENATVAAEFVVSGSADVMIVSPAFGPGEPRGMKEDRADSHMKIMLLLRDHDQEAVVHASSVRADGFLLESELTTASLGEALSRVVHGEVPMPAFLARELLTHQRTQHARPMHRPFLLTPRELQVLALLVEGMSNKQIARRLVVSEHSAKRHVANALAKLNVPNRTLAVALVIRECLLDDVRAGLTAASQGQGPRPGLVR